MNPYNYKLLIACCDMQTEKKYKLGKLARKWINWLSKCLNLTINLCQNKWFANWSNNVVFNIKVLFK